VFVLTTHRSSPGDGDGEGVCGTLQASDIIFSNTGYSQSLETGSDIRETLSCSANCDFDPFQLVQDCVGVVICERI